MKTPIDAFILAKLEAKGLKPVAPADKAALCRRAYYDLTACRRRRSRSTRSSTDTVAGRLGEADRQAARVAALRREVGPALARRGPLRRDQRLRARRPEAVRLAVPRLRHPELQRRQAVRPVRQGATRRRRDARADNPDAVIATGFYRLGLWDDEPADPLQALFDGYDDIVADRRAGVPRHDAQLLPAATTTRSTRSRRPTTTSWSRSSATSGRTPTPATCASQFNLTDITPPEQREVYEAELKQRRGADRRAERQMTAIEDEAIKKMPAEDQRAAEGPDRPQVVAKVPQFLDGKEKAEYAALKRERDRAGEEAAAEPGARPVGEQLRRRPRRRRTC